MTHIKLKICIIPICFNAYDDAWRLLESIDCAYKKLKNIDLEIILSDNSTIDPIDKIDATHYAFTLKHIKNGNIGYFPAFNKALSTASFSPTTFDFVIVCNVDLVVAEDFFTRLVAHSPGEDTGLLAPGIFSDRDGRDLNPKMMRRPSLSKIQFMRLICSHHFFLKGYNWLVRMREHMRAKFSGPGVNGTSAQRRPNRVNMYGAHGSFLIFTKRYFSKGAHVAYPRFLFGEEGFVAEQLRMNDLVIEHVQEIKVFDKEHSSTSKVDLKFICAEHRKSYDYFYENFLKSKE